MENNKKEKYYSYNYINHTVPFLDLSYYTIL